MRSHVKVNYSRRFQCLFLLVGLTCSERGDKKQHFSCCSTFCGDVIIVKGHGVIKPQYSLRESSLLSYHFSINSRHCGRLLCHKCSTKEIPIIKFDLNKPVRVCNICFDVLTLGGVS